MKNTSTGTRAERIARANIAAMSDAKLLDVWETTEKTDFSMELATVRGWLMDEIEKRFPRAFNEWLEIDVNYDGDLREYVQFYGKADV